jgi:hypothetical protein
MRLDGVSERGIAPIIALVAVTTTICLNYCGRRNKLANHFSGNDDG